MLPSTVLGHFSNHGQAAFLSEEPDDGVRSRRVLAAPPPRDRSPAYGLLGPLEPGWHRQRRRRTAALSSRTFIGLCGLCGLRVEPVSASSARARRVWLREVPPTRVPGGCNQRQTVCRY
jgi:hypothetical protein